MTRNISKTVTDTRLDPIGFRLSLLDLTLDDLETLKVKVTNEPVTAIGMWGYMPVGLTGVLVVIVILIDSVLIAVQIHKYKCVYIRILTYYLIYKTVFNFLLNVNYW